MSAVSLSRKFLNVFSDRFSLKLSKFHCLAWQTVHHHQEESFAKVNPSLAVFASFYLPGMLTFQHLSHSHFLIQVLFSIIWKFLAINSEYRRSGNGGTRSPPATQTRINLDINFQKIQNNDFLAFSALKIFENIR